MRLRRLMVPLLAFALIAGACGDDDDGDEGTQSEDTGGGGGDDSGRVVLLTAMEPEEVSAVQSIFDDMINADAEYEDEVEAAGNYAETTQIRDWRGPAKLTDRPRPGRVVPTRDDETPG